MPQRLQPHSAGNRENDEQGATARQNDAEGVIKLLCEIVPTYSPFTEGWKKAVGSNGKSG